MNNKLKYNPNIHHRRSIRLNGYDYAQEGLYFITICCQDRICRFGNVVNGEIILNEYGQIAFDEWVKLSDRFSNIELDVFQIMPNHMHGIIILNDASAGAGITPAQNKSAGAGFTPAQHKRQPQGIASTTVSDIVGAYKSLVVNGCLDIYKSKNATMGKLWQRNYYENIIRNEQSHKRVSEYIINNPVKWAEDKFYKNINSRKIFHR